ncbi:MAG TPA: competence/damage-inducible protein A [Methylomirabilota bacterium]|nr:competence/damage-inducible protein A [Methylomirabilota bacterium]
MTLKIELLNTGAELMLGRVLNTHQQWICRQLADRGYVVDRQVAVDDAGPSICDALREALGRADLVITTGGLGPTSDDRTRDLVAKELKRPLREDPQVLDHIQRMFALRRRPMPASTRVQALVPEGATVLMNARGTAPGLVLETPPRPGQTRPGLLVMLPGPPRELRPMMIEQALPLIEKHFPVEAPFVCRTLRTTGLGESALEEKIAPALRPVLERGVEVGYCARTGEVDVRFVARGARARELVAEAEQVSRALLEEFIYGTDDEVLEQVIVRQLTERRQTLALAESCTGGFIAHRITNVPGASAVFLAGLVTYGNAAKERFLGVKPETLAAHGAVSEAVAGEMAEGARRVTGADYALAATGIAGPTGGSEAKPVGTVFLALASTAGTVVQRRANRFERETFKYVTAQQALDMLRRELVKPPPA